MAFEKTVNEGTSAAFAFCPCNVNDIESVDVARLCALSHGYDGAWLGYRQNARVAEASESFLRC